MLRRSVRRCSGLLDGLAVGGGEHHGGPDPISRLSPFALARLASRSAAEGRSNAGLWRALAARAIAVAPSMQPTDMSTVLSAFARMRYRDRVMMQRLAEATPSILSGFRAADITHFLAAFARLDVEHQLVFNLFARVIARKLHDFTAAQLGELVYAYSRLNMRHDLLFEVLKKRIIEVVRALQPWHLAMVVNGFSRLRVEDERFFTIVASEISRKIPEFPGRPLALVANAYAKLGVQNRFLLEVLGDEVFRRRGELEPQAVALTLNAYARLGMRHPVLFDYFAQDVPRHIKKHTMQSLSLVASAFARQRREEPELFEKIGNFVCENALSLYPRALATFLHSFSEVGVRHGLLFLKAPDHVTKHLEAYTVDELAMIARAYGRFVMVHLPLFDTIGRALQSRPLVPLLPAAVATDMEDEEGLFFEDEPPKPESPDQAPPQASSLVFVLEALARLTIYEAPVIATLCDALAARHAELTPRYVVKATRALSALSFAHQGLLEVGRACLTERGSELPIEELKLLTSALDALGGGVGDSDGEFVALQQGQLLLEQPRSSIGSSSDSSSTSREGSPETPEASDPRHLSWGD